MEGSDSPDRFGQTAVVHCAPSPAQPSLSAAQRSAVINQVLALPALSSQCGNAVLERPSEFVCSGYRTSGTAPYRQPSERTNAVARSAFGAHRCVAVWCAHFVLSLRLVAYGLHEAITGELRARGHTVDGDVRPLR